MSLVLDLISRLTYHVGHRLQIATGLLHDDAVVKRARRGSAQGTSAWLRVSQLTLGFVPVRRSGLLETLYLACHRSCDNRNELANDLGGPEEPVDSSVAKRLACTSTNRELHLVYF